MKLKNKLATIASALVLACSVYAGDETICPDINRIKAEGLNMVEEIGLNIYFGYNINTYNTESNWGFVIAPISADSAELALDHANAILRTMNAPGIPQENNHELICEYNTGNQNIMAVAINAEHMISPLRLKHYIKTAY